MNKDFDEGAPTKLVTRIAQKSRAGAFLKKPLGVDTFKQAVEEFSNL